MYFRAEQGFDLAGGTGVRHFGRAAMPVAAPMSTPTPTHRIRDRAAAIDWVPDLGARVGSRDWWRGAVTCTALLAATWFASPGLDRPIIGAAPAALAGAEWDETRAQGIAPLAWGGGTGRRMAANDLVAPLAQAPERPTLSLSATLGDGDSFDRMLERAGVGRTDAEMAARLLAQAVPLSSLSAGTRIALTLGRRPDRTVARPLDALAMRARFDLNVAMARVDGRLTLDRRPIAVDTTPLRIQGLVGASLYRSARAAGAPARVVESYIKAMATRLSIGRDVHPADSFDMIVEHARAATGETRTGDLLFAGIDQGARRTQLVRWGSGGGAPADQWFDARGQAERRDAPGWPVAGRITSPYGPRMHPLLRFVRMHKGIDIAAPYGTPIRAVVDGVVSFAGRNAGYGNFVKLTHGGGLVSGYGHMSRFAVSPGQRVTQGQVIGYIGSTGLSTGPHLHWEVWRGGIAINPRAAGFASTTRLSDASMRAFKARVATLLAIRPGRSELTSR
ncbi:hypothetical protein ASE75_04115 [Sphingomonas sp. Leaf17]|uniref:M23 family metallopeptidase n=1 Tax=Sphingomonas sp. Leaf17 TaxID=1735683 RepID=UPI0006F21F9E|nr:M23 family metallopeptidase [Sphingomonas sp. Leaf17]KQM68047.1 hypothetical protein ASE75_04115 [Sphingomonas sp. Leaf17]